MFPSNKHGEKYVPTAEPAYYSHEEELLSNWIVKSNGNHTLLVNNSQEGILKSLTSSLFLYLIEYIKYSKASAP